MCITNALMVPCIGEILVQSWGCPSTAILPLPTDALDFCLLLWLQSQAGVELGELEHPQFGTSFHLWFLAIYEILLNICSMLYFRSLTDITK